MNINIDETDNLIVQTPFGIVSLIWTSTSDKDSLSVVINPEAGAIAEVAADNVRSRFSAGLLTTIVKLSKC